MANLTDNTKCKRCRRAGEKLFLKGERCLTAKCGVVRRAFPPGVHGNGRPGKQTNYGLQLKEKQKAKRMYGLIEKQFESYFDKALKKAGNTSDNLFRMLELRLDNTVYRLGFAPSRRQARQMVGHGHFAINGRKTNIPSALVKIGDVVSLREVSKKKKLFAGIKERLDKNKNIVPWLSLAAAETQGKVTSLPNPGDVSVNVNWSTIVEFYSK